MNCIESVEASLTHRGSISGFSCPLAYSVDIYSHEPSSLFHHDSVEVHFLFHVLSITTKSGAKGLRAAEKSR